MRIEFAIFCTPVDTRRDTPHIQNKGHNWVSKLASPARGAWTDTVVRGPSPVSHSARGRMPRSGNAMHPIFSTAPGSGAVRAPRDHRLLYLIVAALCLVAALRFLRRALAPIGVLVQVTAAAAMVGLAVGAALVFLTAAALSAR